MNCKMMAKIHWRSEAQGGRKSLPWGDQYGPVLVTKGTPLIIEEPVWSLMVSNKEILTEYDTLAEIAYLSENAPPTNTPNKGAVILIIEKIIFTNKGSASNISIKYFVIQN